MTRLRNIDNFRKSDLYRTKSHQLIPGGAHTYSKGDDQFPQRAPAAIAFGKGADVWDIDDNQYLDCSMGLTSVSLGHAYPEVCEAVKREVDKGVNFQRPSYIEMEIAEQFLSLTPQHDMIKFAKNGSIVTTAAVKLSRAYTGRNLVAFPGDHPFYSYDDWFIGTTACNKGVPDQISSLSVTFRSYDLSSLEELFKKYPGQIACVITEPEKSNAAQDEVCKANGGPGEFLKKAIELTHKEGALFIIDEMITGFKTNFPGSISKFGLKPDMATWGKGIANGFSFCALTGSRDVMDLGGILNEGADKLFLISTTHGGETHAIAAALATIDVFKKNDVIRHNHNIGDQFITACQNALERHALQDYIQLFDANWMPAFNFMDSEKKPSPALRTLAMQEMIKRGVLFQGAFVPCFSHSPEHVSYFSEAFDQMLGVYSKALESGFEKYLIGQVVKPVFRKKI